MLWVRGCCPFQDRSLVQKTIDWDVTLSVRRSLCQQFSILISTSLSTTASSFSIMKVLANDLCKPESLRRSRELGEKDEFSHRWIVVLMFFFFLGSLEKTIDRIWLQRCGKNSGKKCDLRDLDLSNPRLWNYHFVLLPETWLIIYITLNLWIQKTLKRNLGEKTSNS